MIIRATAFVLLLLLFLVLGYRHYSLMKYSYGLEKMLQIYANWSVALQRELDQKVRDSKK